MAVVAQARWHRHPGLSLFVSLAGAVRRVVGTGTIRHWHLTVVSAAVDDCSAGGIAASTLTKNKANIL